MLSRLFLIYFIACVGCFFVFIMDTTILDSVDFHYPGILITFLIPLLATTLVFNKLMTIFEKYIQAVLVFNVLKFMIATLLLFIAFTKIQEISFFNVFEVLLLSYFIVALTQMLYVIPIIKNNINEIKKAVLEKEWLNLSLSYMINSLVFLLLCTIYFILFRILGDGASVGEFNALILISSILLLVSSASGTVVTPKISALYHNKDFDELQCLINKTFSFDFTVLIIATSSIIALNSYLLGFFGESYLHLNKELIVVAIIVFIGSCNVTVARILVYTNYHKETLLVNVAGIVCSVILGFFLIPNFKLWGGIISFGVVSLTQNVVNFVLIKRKLPLKPFIYF
jgi:O-antigen/teichoic acid export membrane protein